MFIGALPLYSDTSIIYQYKELSHPSPFGPKGAAFFALVKKDYITLYLKDPAMDSVKYLILQDSLQTGIYLLSFENFELTSGTYTAEFRGKDTVTQTKGLLLIK